MIKTYYMITVEDSAYIEVDIQKTEIVVFIKANVYDKGNVHPHLCFYIGETGALWTSGHHEHLSLWQSALSDFDNGAL